MNLDIKHNFWVLFGVVICVSLVVGGFAGWGVVWYHSSDILSSDRSSLKEVVKEEIIKKTTEETAVISAVEKANPAVVSIIATKEMPIMERLPGGFFGLPQYESRGSREAEVGGGSGFLISSDGYIVTNKHVVEDREAEYTVLTNDQERHKVEVLDRDPIIDIAILKMEGEGLPNLDLGDSSDLKVGQTVIAIGNALGEFKNTVSTGVISGLSRSIVAGTFTGEMERLTGMIQTDASINKGNSGGPLLDISGKVIGINTAMASGAGNIGFALPINEVKNVIEDVKEHGRILRPWLGVRYVQLTEEIIESNNLEIDHGALIVSGQRIEDLAVMPGSPADKAGLEANNIILEVNGEKITQDRPLAETLGQYNPGDKVNLKIYSKGEKTNIEVELGERPE